MMKASPNRNPKESVTAEYRTWFDQMTGYLKWKIVGPDIHNPFKTPLPIHLLNRMSNSREFLNQHIQIRCMCDGYEVMMLSNPNHPRISSNHPCISAVDQHLIVDYIQRAGLDQIFDAEIDKIQEEIREHLSTRGKEKEDRTTFLDKEKISEVSKAPKSNKEVSQSKNFRVVKR